MHNFMDFEKPIAALEDRIAELRHLGGDSGLNIADEIAKMQGKVGKLLRQTYSKLTPWERTQVARHPDRPHTMDYINALVSDFTPLAGDRLFAEDPAIVGGLGRIAGTSALVMGQEKGSDTKGRVHHNFGMARPEGYRKAQRLMKLAQRFSLPIVTLIDTPGAYPGIDAEARGQSEAIARSVEVCLELRVPLISVTLGEGGSGGAMALAAANTVLMMEYAVYSVISPEGCASILWRDGDHAEEAAASLKLTAPDLLELGVIDAIIPEPLGGAHRDHAAAFAAVGEAIIKALGTHAGIDGETLREHRRQKFLKMGSRGLG